MLKEAVEARKFSYSPYSNFAVGACLQTEGGATFKGCNVENAGYSPSVCAERTAYVKAVSEGHTKFKAIAVVAWQKSTFTSPCGVCRQIMCEFGDVTVYMSKPDLKEVQVNTLEELLPFRLKWNPHVDQ